MIRAFLGSLQGTARILLVFAGFCGSCYAEEPPPVPLELVSAPAPQGGQLEAPSQHRFFDRENRGLFAIAAALSTADFAVTRANLQSGGTELNPLVRPFARSAAGLALNFAGQTIGTIGLSYVLHKTGHHRLERVTSLLNIGASTAAVTYSLTHR